MSTAEKRHFTLYTKISRRSNTSKYVQLFNFINDNPKISDADLVESGYKATDKNFLKEKIEAALHDLYLGKSITSKLKWLTESMERYFNLKQWTELKRCIYKTKEIARKQEKYLDWLQAIYWEKEMLLTQPESKQLYEKIEVLIKEENEVRRAYKEEIYFYNIKASLNALLLKDIRLSTPKNKKKFNKLASKKRLQRNIEPVSIKSKINYYHVKARIAECKGAYELAYQMAKKIMTVFENNTTFKQEHLGWYYKNICLLCDICNVSNRISEIPHLIELIGTDNQYFKIVCLHGLMYSIQNLDEEKGNDYLNRIEEIIKKNKHQIRAGRQLTIFYNGAVFLSLYGRWSDMYFWIQKITNFQHTDDRRDLQFGARILSLFNCFELKPFEMDKQIQAVTHYFTRNNQYSETNKYIIQSFRHLLRAIDRKAMLPVWKDLRDYLNTRAISSNKSTQQLGVGELSIWCTSKIENISMAEVHKRF